VIFVIPTAVAVAWLVRVRGTAAEHIAKPLSSLGFLLVALSEGALDSTYGQIVLAGLLLGALGDVALMFERWFLGGLVLFAAGHIAYIVAFADRASPTIPSVAIASVTAIAAGAWLLPRIDMRMAVAFYIVVISVMLATGLAAGQSGYVRVGAAAFALSDLLVARERFLTSDPRNAMWGLPLYYTAQVLIALSVAQ
jgi:uncharacterized membrane protein YhhN